MGSKLVKWVKEAYRNEWPLMGINVTSYFISLTAGSCASQVSTNFTQNPVTISGIATAVDYVLFWGTFLGMAHVQEKKSNSHVKRFRTNIALLTILEATYI